MRFPHGASSVACNSVAATPSRLSGAQTAGTALRPRVASGAGLCFALPMTTATIDNGRARNRAQNAVVRMLRLAARCMFLLLALAALPSAAALARGNPMAREGALSSPVHEIMVEKDVMVPLRDGTLASIDIYRPRASGRFPVLVEGTAYAKSCQ